MLNLQINRPKQTNLGWTSTATDSCRGVQQSWERTMRIQRIALHPALSTVAPITSPIRIIGRLPQLPNALTHSSQHWRAAGWGDEAKREKKLRSLIPRIHLIEVEELSLIMQRITHPSIAEALRRLTAQPGFLIIQVFNFHQFENGWLDSWKKNQDESLIL